MKIAISDYDGTLSINGEVSKNDVAAIDRWRENGNLFAIATARDLSLTAPELKKWGLQIDYLIAVNGAMLYDGQLDPVYSVNIPNEFIKPILIHNAALQSLHFALCKNGTVKLHILDEKSWYHSHKSGFEELAYSDTLSQTGLQQISLAYMSCSECHSLFLELNKEFGNQMTIQMNDVCIDVNAKGVNKLFGVKSLINMLAMDMEKVLVVGDGENDIDMISVYDGYAVANAKESVKCAAKQVVPDIASMLDDHVSY